MADYDLLSADFYCDPYPILAEMRREDPCWFDHRLGAFVLTRYGDVARVLQGEDFSAQRVRQFTRGAPDHLRAKVEVYVDALERWLLFVDPPHHTRLRARLQRAFGPALLPVIGAASRDAVVLAMLAEKRRTPSDDMLSALARPLAEESEEVDDEDLVGLVMSMIVAGHETSTNLIGNALRAVMLDPELRERVCGRSELPEAAIEEFVRFDGPVASMLRRAKRDIVIAGTFVPEGSFLFSFLLSANRDPRQFPSPDRLDLNRPLPAHVGFGVGMHRCVGAFMARTVVRKAVQAFARRYPGASLGDGCIWQHNTSFRGMAAMPVELGRAVHVAV